jgi:hypothetical protein
MSVSPGQRSIFVHMAAQAVLEAAERTQLVYRQQDVCGAAGGGEDAAKNLLFTALFDAAPLARLTIPLAMGLPNKGFATFEL